MCALAESNSLLAAARWLGRVWPGDLGAWSVRGVLGGCIDLKALAAFCLMRICGGLNGALTFLTTAPDLQALLKSAGVARLCGLKGEGMKGL